MSVMANQITGNWTVYSTACSVKHQRYHESTALQALCEGFHRWLVISSYDDDVIKWKHFPRNWPFVREIHRSPVNFPHKGQWRGALMFSLIYAWINDWINNREAGDLRRQHGHYDVIVMWLARNRENVSVPWRHDIYSSKLSVIFTPCSLAIGYLNIVIWRGNFIFFIERYRYQHVNLM